MHQSRIFKELSVKEIHELVTLHFGNSKDIEINLLKGGLFNTTYKLKLLPTLRELVLRVGPVNREYLLDFEQNLMEAECHIYELLTKRGIPCPVLVARDFSKSWIDRDYMITEYMISKPLSDESITSAAKDQLFEQAGKWTAEIHKINGPKFGRVSDILRNEGHDTWEQFLISHINEICVKCRRFGVLEQNIINRIIHVFENLKDIYRGVITPKLVHADLWAGNILVTSGNNENLNELAAIIDVDRAVFGDIDFEFSSPWMINDSFLKGYGTYNNNPENQVKMNSYKLIYSCIDTYVWKVQYQNQTEYENSKRRTMELLNLLEEQICI
ncbi:phosphotransferase [Paenibacillus sp. EC2-1]|uniref:phosphotransferase n=1 Tax=Paenibacillus sp. EC2-1 TaxID=3388665 RepID=UPI003BEEE6E3